MQPKAIAAAFCVTRLDGDDEGVRGLLAPSLLAEIVEAEDRNLAAAQAAPDGKPPFADGIPYQSFPDLPDGCIAGNAEPAGDGFHVPVTYSFEGSPNAGWTDRLVLVGDGTSFLIEDIVFRGAPDAWKVPTLRNVLRDAFDR